MTPVRQPWHIDPSLEMQAAAERGLRFLDKLMPSHIRAPEPEKPVALAVAKVDPRKAGVRVLGDRNAQIRTAIDAGTPTVEIAKVWGLSVSQVNRAYREGEAA